MGAVRLSIIDLAGGDQPIKSDDGDTVVVFNGEIYNHALLRAELERAGHKFRSRCDTEVVLRGFLEWDTGVFERLRGMFAIALWTQSKRRLVLARDRMGIKPLYVHFRGDDVHFGSELKTIFEHPEVERRISPEGLNWYLSLNYIPAPWTMVDGITKLGPGQYLEWRDGRTKTEAYWKLCVRPDERISFDDAKTELDRLMRESVAEHMISDVPLGVWASGGVDSTTVLHYASQATSAQLKTFSVSFLGRKFDESPWFREVAKFYNTDHHEFDLNADVEIVDAIEQMSYYSDEPSADAGALPVWFLSKMTKRHVTVALSGEGADELFGGYQTYLADRYARWMQFAPAPLRRLGLQCLNALPVSDDKISLEYKLKRFLKGSLLKDEQAHLFWNGTNTAAERRALLNDFRETERLMPADAPSDLNRYLWLDQICYLPDDILYKCDRMSMAHSLEVRPPFLDHRIVEYAALLPESLKVHGSKLKYVLKELVRDKVPPSVLTRKKEGFDIPAHHWFRTVLKPIASDVFSRSNVEATGLFRYEAIETLIQSHQQRRANVGYHLWGLLTLFLWMRRWKIETHPAVAGAEVISLTN